VIPNDASSSMWATHRTGPNYHAARWALRGIAHERERITRAERIKAHRTMSHDKADSVSKDLIRDITSMGMSCLQRRPPIFSTTDHQRAKKDILHAYVTPLP